MQNSRREERIGGNLMRFEGMNNARDLGGMVTADGKQVRKGLFLRTDALNALTDDDVRELTDNQKVSLIIDLRTSEEKMEKPDREIREASYYHIPVFSSAQAGVTREEDAMATFIRELPDMRIFYRKMVEDDEASGNVCRALRLIMNNEQGCSLFHCVAGKDRTGILAMLILGILGVSEEDIMEDYMLTNVSGREIAGQIAEMVLERYHNEELAERVKAACTADEGYLNAALDYIHSEYGTIPDYCRDKLGISEEEMDVFRQKALVRRQPA